MTTTQDTIRQALENHSAAFETFTQANDQRLGEILDRIEDIEAKRGQPGATSESKQRSEYRQEFLRWMRAPADPARNNRLAEASADLRKDITIGTTSAGGFALPEEIGRQIEKRVEQLNPFRQLVSVRSTSTNDYKELLAQTEDASSGWVSETGSRTATTTPAFRERAPTMGEIYAYPQVSEWALDDLFFDVEAWLTEVVGDKFASAEATAIVSGNGSNKPTGLLNSSPVTTTDDASPVRDAATLMYLGLTNAGSPVAINYDSLVELIHSPKEAYLMDSGACAFVMHRTTLAAVQRIKDTTGQPIWQPSLVPGTPSTLLGYPVYTTSAMPTLAADANVVIFGNFRRGYILAERTGMRITVDNVTNPGYVRFYLRARRGGCVLNNDALRVLKLAD